jgi:hypothetical protein
MVRCTASALHVGYRSCACGRAGGNCEGIIRKQSDETGTTSTTLGASFMNWRGDVALGGNAQVRACLLSSRRAYVHAA